MQSLLLRHIDLSMYPVLYASIVCPFISSVQFSHSVVSNSLRLHGLQHAKLPCPSPSPGACSNSCLLSRWCHPTTSSSSAPLSSCPQSFPASGSFPRSQFFTSGGQSIGVSASASVLHLQLLEVSLSPGSTYSASRNSPNFPLQYSISLWFQKGLLEAEIHFCLRDPLISPDLGWQSALQPQCSDGSKVSHSFFTCPVLSGRKDSRKDFQALVNSWHH